MGKGKTFQQVVLLIDYPQRKKVKWDHNFTSFTQIHSKGVKALTLNSRGLKIFKENIRKVSFDLQGSKRFF